MKHWKKQGKRGLSLFLSLVMCLSMINLTAFAESNGLKEGEVADGAFVADQSSKTLSETFTEGASNTVTAGDKIEITKDAKAILSEDGNQFEVTLTVVTKDQEITQVKSPDAAVSLVIDVSGSMARCSECGAESCTHLYPLGHQFNDQWRPGHPKDGKCDEDVGRWDYQACGKTEAEHKGGQTRLEAAKASAQDFLDSLKKHTPKNSDGTYPARYVSVAAFSNGASRECEWKDIMTQDGYDAVLSAINGLNANGGTNLEQGLSKANGLMQDTAVNKVDKGNKFTVVLTDGEPTYYGWSYGQPEGGKGSEASKDTCKKAIEAGKDLKKNSNAIYSVFYGDASAKKCYDANGSKCTIEEFLKAFSNSVYSADKADQLTTAFENISETIALLTKAWTVTDHMAEGVTFVEVTSNQGTDVASEAGGILTWDLKADVAHTEGSTRTYTLTYLVTVDATGEDYDEEAVHALNGYTDLTYVIEGADGGYTDVHGNPVSGENPPTVGFNVPGVKVERPERPWRIEYYKQENATAGDYENYTLAKTTNGGPDKLWTPIVLKDVDPDWEGKYTSENYKHASSNQSIVVGMDEETNVIRVYYNRMTTSVTVNHYYGEITVNGDGQKVEPNWETIPPIPKTEAGKFVGESYTAEELVEHGGRTYTLDHANPISKTITLKEAAGENVINLYYVWDDRGDTSVTVNHVYRTHTWGFEDNKWVLKTTTDEVEVETQGNLKVGDSYTTTHTTAEGFQADPSNYPTIDKLAESGNVIILYFDKYEGTEPKEALVVVNHHYLTRTVTVDDNGEIQTKVEVEDVNGTAEAGHVGDVVDITEAPREGFVADSANLKYVTLKSGLNTVNLWYSKVDEPASASIRVTHTYYTIQHVIETEYKEVPVLDPETSEPTGETVQEVVGTKEYDVKTEDTDQNEEETISGLYANQLYTAGAKYKGYTPYDTNVYSGRATVDGLNTIELKYYKDTGDVDRRDKAWIGVTHKYITHLTTLVEQPDGTTSVGITDVIAYGSRDEYEGKKGETYVAKPEPNLGSHTYTKISPDDSALTVVLTGNNDDIEIVYEREETQLPETATGYTVDYVYNTYVMAVDPDTGVAGYGEPTVERGEQVTSGDATLYVGQIVKLDAGAKDGFEADVDNPSTLQILQADGNHFTFVWNKYEPLPKVKVTVNHHYETITIDRDGTQHSSTDDVSGWPVEKYTGESYEASAREYWGGQFTLNKAAVNSEDVTAEKTITVKADRNVVIDFYYSRTEDHSCPVNYSIQYYYYDVDYDETETLTGAPTATTGSSFAGKPLTTNPEKEDVKGYRLTKATFNEVDIMGQQSVTLVDGENKIVYVYKRSVDTRPKTTLVTVYHQYYSSDSAESFAYEDMVVTRDLPIGSSFTAEEITTKNGDTYLRTTPDSELTKELKADSGSNIIHIRYVLAKTTYKVVHAYYTNGSLTGSTDPVTVGGNVGDVVSADSIAKVLTYGGNSYRYTSADNYLVLVQGENGTITLRYDRTTGGGGGGGNNNDDDDDDDDNGGNRNPVTPPDVNIPDEQPPLIEEPVIDIPDEQPPLEEAPEEEEILEEEVPLSDVPQTGDNSKPAFWAALGALSFLGIVLLGRKRKDEEA